MNRLPYKTKIGNVDVVQDFSGIISHGGAGHSTRHHHHPPGKGHGPGQPADRRDPPTGGIIVSGTAVPMATD